MNEFEIRDTWHARSDAETETAIAKGLEYGSIDLKIMGGAMLQLLGPEAWDRVVDLADDANGYDQETHGQLMAIAFYELGKVARLWGALVDGRVPSTDTLADIRVYAHMANTIIETGEWHVVEGD